MTYFYLSVAAILAIALGFVCFPLLRKTDGGANQQSEQTRSNVKVVKQRIAELEQEFAQGLIDQSEKDQAVRDLKLALADESTVNVTEQTRASNVIWLVGIVCIAVGAIVYWQASQLQGLYEYNDAKAQVDSLRLKLEQQGPQSLTPEDFEKFVVSIRANLRENPDDARAWGYLAMVSTSLGRAEQGVAAYKKAIELSPSDTNLRFKYAEALMFQGTERSLNESKRQLLGLMQQQPEARNYRLLLTSVAIQLQDAELALNQFKTIQKQLNPSSDFYKTIVSELKRLGVADESVVGGTSELASAPETQTKGPAIVVNVNIDDDLRESLPEQGYLIVFAQLNDGSSRAPLAVKRLALPSLPTEIMLSDNDAMIPAMNLSSATLVKITARISIDENVMQAAGELEGVVTDITVDNSKPQRVDVLINRILQ